MRDNSLLTWTSSNTSVLTVDPKGNFNSLGAGSSTVTASYKSWSTSQIVTVVAPVIPSVTIYCDGTPFSAAAWNSSYTKDPGNLTQWAVTDPVSCASYKGIVLVDKKSNYSMFWVTKAASGPVYGFGYSLSITSTPTDPQTVAGNTIIVGESAGYPLYTPIKTFVTNP
jgi:hypothetical protein